MPAALTAVLWHSKEAENAKPAVAQKLIYLPPQLVPAQELKKTEERKST